MGEVTSKNLQQCFATKFPDEPSGRYCLRLILDSTSTKTNIVARSSFVSLILFIDKLICWLFRKERNWIAIYLKDNQSSNQSKILLNIRSVCKRTLLSREELLKKPTSELSKIFADPSSILWSYKKLQEHFPHSYLIHQEKRPESVQALKHHLNTIGQSTLAYTLHAAVNGDTLTKDTYDKMSQSVKAKNTGKDDGRDRYVRLLTHLNVLREARSNKHSHALIMEDNIRFMPKPLAGIYLQKIFDKQLPPDWGMLFLGHQDTQPEKASSYSEYLMQPGCPHDLHAYVVNSSMYDTLIETLEKELAKTEKGSMRSIDAVVAEDLVQNPSWRGKIFACKQNIAIQDEKLNSNTNQVIAKNYSKELTELDIYYKVNPIQTADNLPIMSPLLAGTLYQMTYHLTNIFDKHGIRYWADGGTLLGIARYQGLIPHDDDVDLGIFPEDIPKLKNEQVLQDLKKLGLRIEDHWLGIKVCCIKNHPLGQVHEYDGHQYSTPSIDLFFTQEIALENGEKAYQYSMPKAFKYWSKLTHLHNQLFDENNMIKKKKFGPIEICAPSEKGMKEYCDKTYGKDWPFEIYVQWDHIKEKGLRKIPKSFTDARLGPVEFWPELPPHIKGFASG